MLQVWGVHQPAFNISPSAFVYFYFFCPNHPFLPPCLHYPPSAFTLCEDNVKGFYKGQNTRKAPGPDQVSPFCLKSADQLAPIFTQLFNKSLEVSKTPSCFNAPLLSLSLKQLTSQNEYRPVALTSEVMKCFERLVMVYLKIITGSLLDPFQFVCGRRTEHETAVYFGAPLLSRDSSMNFSSDFNTIIPDILHFKLSQLTVPNFIYNCIINFLANSRWIWEHLHPAQALGPLKGVCFPLYYSAPPQTQLPNS